MGQSIQEWTKKNLWKIAFKKFERVWSVSGRPYPFKFFEACLPQILLGPLLNTLSHIAFRSLNSTINNYKMKLEESIKFLGRELDGNLAERTPKVH